jgi:hypothetical protein
MFIIRFYQKSKPCCQNFMGRLNKGSFTSGFSHLCAKALNVQAKNCTETPSHDSLPSNAYADGRILTLVQRLRLRHMMKDLA